MTTYAFTARDESGSSSNGTLTAATIAEAVQQLRQGGKYPISIRPLSASSSSGDAADAGHDAARSGRAASGTSAGARGLKVGRADIIQFSTQLAVMVETGVTLVEALDCIAQTTVKPNVRRLVEDLSVAVQGGTDLSAAMGRHPRSFPRLYVSLIRASEKSGMLSKLLRRATEYMRDEQEMLRRVKGALTYPAIMLGFAVTTTIFLLAFVLPRFTTIYAGKGAALPLPTKVLMAMSNFVVGQWPVLVAGVLAITVAGFAFLRTPAGARFFHSVQISIPAIGGLFRKLYLARSMRMIGTLTAAGVGVLEAVSTAIDLCGNTHFQRLWTDVSSKIQEGRRMADAMGANPLVPRSVVQMIHAGEKGGKLSHVMEQVATYSEQGLKETIAELTRYIEPVMIIVMGLIIGTVALALMLPIFTISRVVAH